MKRRLLSIVLMLSLVMSVFAMPGFAMQDPLVMDVVSVKYNADQSELLLDVNFVNTSGRVISPITEVEVAVTVDGKSVAAATVDVIGQKTVTVMVGSSTPYQLALKEPVKDMDVSKAKVDYRVAYSTAKGVELPKGKKIYYKGVSIALDVQPTVIDGRMMIPARAVFEKMNCSVQWDAASRSVDVARGDRRIVITIDQNFMLVDSKAVKLEVPATIVEGRTLVPLRAISNALGARIVYGEANEMAVIFE